MKRKGKTRARAAAVKRARAELRGAIVNWLAAIAENAIRGRLPHVMDIAESPLGAVAEMRDALVRIERLARVTDDEAGAAWNADIAHRVRDIATDALAVIDGTKDEGII